jgi:hypothetical protein
VTENQHGRIVHRGTKGSNPLSSSAESGANLLRPDHDGGADSLRRYLQDFPLNRFRPSLRNWSYDEITNSKKARSVYWTA